MSYHDLNNLDAYPDIATALGTMMVAWADAETSILFAMAAVLGIPTDMASFGFYRIPTFEARVKFIQALVPEWKSGTHDKAAIAKTIDAISGLSGARNRWVHGVWCEDRAAKQVVVLNFRAPEGKGRVSPVKAHDIRHHTDRLRTHSKELRHLLPEQPTR